MLTLTITKSKERESKNVCRQTYSFLEVKLDQATGYASEENRSRSNKTSDKDLSSVLANSSKGRTIRKVMMGEEDKEKKFMQKESPIMTFI